MTHRVIIIKVILKLLSGAGWGEGGLEKVGWEWGEGVRGHGGGVFIFKLGGGGGHLLQKRRSK